jgi:hypothetical protein
MRLIVSSLVSEQLELLSSEGLPSGSGGLVGYIKGWRNESTNEVVAYRVERILVRICVTPPRLWRIGMKC